MKSIETPSSWFKDTLAFDQLNAIAATTGQILLQDMAPGVILSEVVIKPITRFEGVGLGVLVLDLVDEFGKTLLAHTARVGIFTNNITYYHVPLADIIPLGAFNTAPDKVYAKFTVEDATLYEKTVITTIPDTAGSIGGDHFRIGTDTYVWYNTGASADPAPGGAFTKGVVVNVIVGETAIEVARKTYLAMAALASSDFVVSWDGTNRMLILDLDAANTTDASAQTSGFTIAKEINGGGATANFTTLTAGVVDVFIKFSRLF